MINKTKKETNSDYPCGRLKPSTVRRRRWPDAGSRLDPPAFERAQALTLADRGSANFGEGLRHMREALTFAQPAPPPHPPTSHRFRALSERERVRLPTPSHAPAWPLRWLTASVGRGSRPRGARRGLATSLEGSDRRRTSSSTRQRQREQAQSPAGRTTRVAPHLPPTRTSFHPHIISATSHSAPALLAHLQALWRREQSSFAHTKARPGPPLPRPHKP
eukprot:scaffold77709_cov42-Phaeocystis_antarctica.AAC.1